LLFKPDRQTPKVLLVLHGNGTSSIFYHVEKNKIMAEKLLSKGIAYFPFNNRGAHLIKRLEKINEKGQIEKQNYGTAYEQIKDCIIDIDSALDFLKTQGYREFYLLGYSTGANKICVYNYYQPDNPISKFILAGGGDDTGLFYQQVKNKTRFCKFLSQAKTMIKQGKGQKFIPKYILDYPMSYQAYFDTANPDGDYNVFPFYEALNKTKLSSKKLFREYLSLKKPTLVVYGQNDEYCYGRVEEAVNILKKQTALQDNYSYQIIPGADHGFSQHNQELASLVSDWLIE